MPLLVDQWYSIWPRLDGHVEFIFVDDGSVKHPLTELPEETVSRMRDMGAIYTLQPHALPRTATQSWNFGLSLAEGAWILLSQTDVTVLNTDSLGRFVYGLIDQPLTNWVIIPVYCVNKAKWITGQFFTWEKPWQCMFGQLPCPLETGDSTPFFLSAIPRWWLKKIGGVDVRYKDGYGYEDIDLVMQRKRDGLGQVHYVDCVGVHRGPPSVWFSSPERNARFVRNCKEFIHKWGSYPDGREIPLDEVQLKFTAEPTT